MVGQTASGNVIYWRSKHQKFGKSTLFEGFVELSSLPLYLGRFDGGKVNWYNWHKLILVHYPISFSQKPNRSKYISKELSSTKPSKWVVAEPCISKGSRFSKWLVLRSPIYNASPNVVRQRASSIARQCAGIRRLVGGPAGERLLNSITCFRIK